MPRNGGKHKIQWIPENASRNATFRQRRATLLEKAKELSILCNVPVAMVVYGPGNSEPAFYPPELAEAKGIMQKYLELPEFCKETHRLDNEGFLRQGLEKMGKRFESYKDTTRQLEVNLILNDISLGRRSTLDDLAPELAAAVRWELQLLRSAIHGRANRLASAAAAVVPPPPAQEEAAAAAAVLVSSQEEPLMVAPLAMAPPMVANTPLFVQPPPLPMVANTQLLVQPPPLPMVTSTPLFVQPPLLLEPDLLQVPPQEPLMVPPFAMAPPMLADWPDTLLSPPVVAVGDDGFPQDGSYLLDVADAILDDGSGHAIQATEEDVDLLLWEHGLESFIKPKPI